MDEGTHGTGGAGRDRGLCWSATPALASSNAATTQRYVQDNYALVRLARTHLATARAGPLHVLAQVRAECPGAGVGSPQNPDSTQMSDEVIAAMVVSAYEPDLSCDPHLRRRCRRAQLGQPRPDERCPRLHRRSEDDPQPVATESLQRRQSVGGERVQHAAHEHGHARRQVHAGLGGARRSAAAARRV